MGLNHETNMISCLHKAELGEKPMGLYVLILLEIKLVAKMKIAWISSFM